VEQLKNKGIWKHNSVYYTRGTMGMIIGPLFFGWIPLLVLGTGLETHGLAFFTQWSAPLIFVSVSWFICAYLFTLKHFVRVDFKEQKVVTGKRHFFWWFGRSEPIGEKARVVLDLHEGAMVDALSGGTGQEWCGTTLYARLRLIEGDNKTVLWEQTCSPLFASFHFVTREYRILGEKIAEGLKRPFEDQTRHELFMKELDIPREITGVPLECRTKKQTIPVVFMLFFAMAFLWSGLKVGVEEAIAPGILFGGVGAVMLYGTAYLLFRKVSIQTHPRTGHLFLRRGWFGPGEQEEFTLDKEARIIIHPTNGDTPEKSTMGHKRVHALGFHAALFVNGSFMGIPQPNEFHFADVYLFAQQFASATGVTIQLLGRASLQAHKNLQEHPPLEEENP